MIKFIKSVYLNNRLYFFIALIVVMFVFGQFFYFFYSLGKVMLWLVIVFTFIDLVLLYNTEKGIMASRITPDRLSNGDDNDISINIKSNYKNKTYIKIIDELPYQFQIRNFLVRSELRPNTEKTFSYKLKPVKRGEYHFGNINVYVSGIIGLISKRFRFDASVMVPVYPSYIQMKRFELLAVSNRLTEAGIKKIRRKGHHTEFDQIREYVTGDDYRTINWKATARKANLMVNQYQDERSQQIYNIIDMGRVMKMPFEGMSLLDYAINASLVISNIAMLKHDKAGLITFNDKVRTFLTADRKSSYMIKILEILYNQKSTFAESNYELLYATIQSRIRQRSLLLLFTNFESLNSLNRQIHYMQRLAKSHLIVAIFFENTEIKKLINTNPENIEDIYTKTIAEKLEYEKRRIVKELNKYGIHAILTEPENLTVNTINKYLELKALGLI